MMNFIVAASATMVQPVVINLPPTKYAQTRMDISFFSMAAAQFHNLIQDKLNHAC